MIGSMTGFGEASSHVDGVHYFLEVRSLNGKYFKATIRLPEDLQGLEPVLEAALRRRLVRGTITAIGKCSDVSGSAAHEINTQALKNYLKQIAKVSGGSDAAAAINVAELLSLPGVLNSPLDEGERFARAREAFDTLMVEACTRLSEMRAREGKLLVDDLMGHHKSIAQELEQIATRTPQVVDDYQQRLRARIDVLLKDARVQVEPGDLIREVAVYAERSDISEEVARLKGHLEQFQTIIDGADTKPVGRTLDFLAQEMLREANTIASKSSDTEISRRIVTIKGAIDRIKEQIQNVL